MKMIKSNFGEGEKKLKLNLKIRLGRRYFKQPAMLKIIQYLTNSVTSF